MKLQQFLSVVPNGFKKAAPILLCFIVLGGLFAGYHQHRHPSGVGSSSLGGSVGGLAIGLGAGLFIAAWVICLGFVYGDAHRRAMPPILSTLMAAFVPNLLGFLIYFVIRRPIALPCSQCGKPMRADHPFCSWCGYQENQGGNQGPQSTGNLPPGATPGFTPTATA